MNGPGLPPVGTPVVDALSPLARALQTNRGTTKVIDPPGKPCGDSAEIGVLNLASWPGCVNGYLLCVTLGIEIYRARCEPMGCIQEGFADASVRAVLTWGLGDAPFHAECDWLLGTQLSIAADNIQIGARYQKRTLPWDPTPFDAPSFKLSAGLGLGNVGRNSNPARLTEIVQLEEPGETCTIEIPPFALSFTVLLVLPATLAEVRVFGFGKGYTTPVAIVSPMTNVGQYNVENAFPIRNGARFVEIKNIAQHGPLVAYVVFGLSL